jgi:hypothetical protein
MSAAAITRNTTHQFMRVHLELVIGVSAGRRQFLLSLACSDMLYSTESLGDREDTLPRLKRSHVQYMVTVAERVYGTSMYTM